MRIDCGTQSVCQSVGKDGEDSVGEERRLTGLAAADEAAGEGGPRTARPEHHLLPPQRHRQ